MTKPTGIAFALRGLCLLATLVLEAAAGDPQPKGKRIHDALPDPDGKPADVSRTVSEWSRGSGTILATPWKNRC